MTASRFESLLRRGVAEVTIEQELIKLLESGKRLRLKQGFDPSTPDIHLGHVVGLRKLRQFQELGHTIILIVGDWTARIGDPSGQVATRPMLSPQEVEANTQTYLKQFFEVVDKAKTEVRWQSEWYDKFGLGEVIKLTSKSTIAQLMAREDFNKRFSAGNPISLAEMLYPLLQAYDSVVIQADVELGGTDQKFNCLLGRELQQMTGQPPQQVLLVPLLVGTDGKLKMSKTFGNHIGIDEPPQEMYGKVMSIPDHLIIDYFQLVTDVPEEEITEFGEQLGSYSINPMILKKRLAYEIAAQFHGVESAKEAERYFSIVFQQRKLPDEIPEYAFTYLAGTSKGTASVSGNLRVEHKEFRIDIAPTLVKEGIVKSNSELKRLLAQGAIELDGNKISSNIIDAHNGSVLKVGKRDFVRIAIESSSGGL